MIDIQAFATIPAKAGFMLLAYGQGIAFRMVSAPHQLSSLMHGRNEAAHSTKFRFFPAYTLFAVNGHAKKQQQCCP